MAKGKGKRTPEQQAKYDAWQRQMGGYAPAPSVGMGGYQGGGWTWADLWDYLNQQPAQTNNVWRPYAPRPYDYTGYVPASGYQLGYQGSGQRPPSTIGGTTGAAKNLPATVPASYVTGYGPMVNNPYYNAGYSGSVVQPDPRQLPAQPAYNPDAASQYRYLFYDNMYNPVTGQPSSVWSGSGIDYGMSYLNTKLYNETGSPGTLNKYGQPVGTPGALINHGTRRQNAYARQYTGSLTPEEYGRRTTTPHEDGGDAHMRPGRRPPRTGTPRPKQPGKGVTGAYTGGIASFNV